MSHAAYRFCRPSFLVGVGQADAAPRSWPRRGCARYRSAISGVVEPGRTTSPLWSFQQVGPTLSHPRRAEGRVCLGCCAVRVGASEPWRRGPTRTGCSGRVSWNDSSPQEGEAVGGGAEVGCHVSRTATRLQAGGGGVRGGAGAMARAPPPLSRLVTMLTSCLEAGAKGLRRSMTAGEEGTRACQSKLPRFSPGLIVDICTDCSTSDGTMECEDSEWGAFESAERSRRDPLHHAPA